MMNFAKVVHVITKLSQSFIRQRVPQHVDVSVPVSSHPLPLHKISKKKKMTKIITSRIISYDNTSQPTPGASSFSHRPISTPLSTSFSRTPLLLRHDTFKQCADSALSSVLQSALRILLPAPPAPLPPNHLMPASVSPNTPLNPAISTETASVSVGTVQTLTTSHLASIAKHAQHGTILTSLP